MEERGETEKEEERGETEKEEERGEIEKEGSVQRYTAVE